MGTQALLFILSFLLLIVILVMLFLGCSCFTGMGLGAGKEGFANGPRISVAEPKEAMGPAKPKKAPKDNGDDDDNDDDDDRPVELTAAETELFDDLRNNRLSSNDINGLVKAKILTTSVVEKFMKKLEENYEGETIVDPLQKKEGDTVEGFSAQQDCYARW